MYVTSFFINVFPLLKKFQIFLFLHVCVRVYVVPSLKLHGQNEGVRSIQASRSANTLYGVFTVYVRMQLSFSASQQHCWIIEFILGDINPT
jgi:hypothetical protein